MPPSSVALRAHTHRVAWCFLSHEATTLATASSDGTFRLYSVDVGSGRARNAQLMSVAPRTVLEFGENILSAALLADEFVLITFGGKTVKKLQLSSGACVLEFVGHVNVVSALKLCAAGLRMLTGSDDNTARLWNTQTAEPLLVLPHSHWVQAVDVSADGSYGVTGSNDAKLQFWHLADLANPLLHKLARHQSSVLSVVLLDREGRPYALSAGWCVPRSWAVQAPPADSGACTRDGLIILWDVVSGREANSFRFHANGDQDAVFSLSMSGNKRFCACGSARGDVAVFDVFAPTPRIWRGSVHTNSVLSVCLSSNGFLVSGAEDWNAVLTDVWRQSRAGMLVLMEALHPRLGLRSGLKNLRNTDLFRLVRDFASL
jgi:WD40 repeat protein